MNVTVTCPTCGVPRTETHCDHCGKLIPAVDLGTVATLIGQPSASSTRYLCGTCSTLSLVPANVGNPEPTPIP